MGIAFDADIRQMHECCIAAVAVDGLYELLGHGKLCAPFILADIFRTDLDVIPIIEDNRNPCEFQEVFHRYAHGRGG